MARSLNLTPEDLDKLRDFLRRKYGVPGQSGSGPHEPAVLLKFTPEPKDCSD